MCKREERLSYTSELEPIYVCDAEDSDEHRELSKHYARLDDIKSEIIYYNKNKTPARDNILNNFHVQKELLEERILQLQNVLDSSP